MSEREEIRLPIVENYRCIEKKIQTKSLLALVLSLSKAKYKGHNIVSIICLDIRNALLCILLVAVDNILFMMA